MSKTEVPQDQRNANSSLDHHRPYPLSDDRELDEACRRGMRRWAILDIAEGGSYGHVVSLHDTHEAAYAEMDRRFGPPVARLSGPLPGKMWAMKEVDGLAEVGQRIRR